MTGPRPKRGASPPRLVVERGGAPAAPEPAPAGGPRVGTPGTGREPGEPRDEHLFATGLPPRGRASERHPDRVRAAALDDPALVAAMRDGDPWAWAEFHARFRPVLLGVAGRMRLPDGCATTETDALVDEVLADEAMRLTTVPSLAAANLAGYLVRAAQHKLATLRRAAGRRQRWHEAAAVHEPDRGTVVVATACSEHLLRTSALGAGAGAELAGRDGEAASGTLLALAAAVRATTTDKEALLLTWVAEGVSHRVIAGWLGVSYDAASKRIWRLCRKVREATLRRVERLAPAERAELERFLRRAGALPPLVRAVSPAAAQRHYPRTPFDDDDPPAAGTPHATSRPPDAPQGDGPDARDGAHHA